MPLLSSSASGRSPGSSGRPARETGIDGAEMLMPPSLPQVDEA
jgi:hypothetical protein